MNNFLQKVQKNFEFSLKNYDIISKSRYWHKSIEKKKKLFKLKNLNNFRSNSLSENIDDFYLNKKQLYNLFKNLNLLCGIKFIEKFLISRNIGKAKKIIKIKNKFITASDLFHIKYIHELKEKIDFKKINTICEIGQGFALLASKLLMIKNFKIILIDLPESNYISSFFINKIYPKKKIIMDIDLKNQTLSEKNFKKGDIFILSPWIEIEKIKIDLFINSRSMMEMNYKSISNYFELIQKKISDNGYFLCINKYYKDLVGYPIEFHRYPYDNKWKTVISKISWKQSQIHFLLVKRVKEKYSDIASTLKEIKENYYKIVKNDKIFIRRVMPVELYRIYKLIKNFLSK